MLEAEKRAAVQRMRADNDFVTQLSAHTQRNLEAQLVRLSAERDKQAR